MSTILIGETDEDLATAMREFFSMDHYTVQLENNGLCILHRLRHNQYDLIILEIALLGLDGIGVVRGYRATGGNTPILLIAGKHCSDELQRGLDAGADAYLVKPFQLSDLAAQLRALLRRPALRSEKVIRVGDLEMNTEAGIMTRNDVPIHLHPMEFKLLHFLMCHQNQVFSAHTLFERVWQKDFGSAEDTVRTHVRTLRRKLDPEGGPSIITTVRGLGYKVSLQQGAHPPHRTDAVRTLSNILPMETGRYALRVL